MKPELVRQDGERVVDIDRLLADTDAHYRAQIEAEIVAWLRKQMESARSLELQNFYRFTADDIERGAHRSEP